MCHYRMPALLLPSCQRNAHTIHLYKNNLDINFSMMMTFLIEFSQYFDEFRGCLQPGNSCTLLHYFRNTAKYTKQTSIYFI